MTGLSCQRCRGTGIVFVRPPSEFDTRTVTSEMPCDCAASLIAAARARKRQRAVRNGILPAVEGRT